MNTPVDAQKRQELEDEMSRFEKEISGHTIDRPIIGTNTFRQASRSMYDGHPEPLRGNAGRFFPPNSNQGGIPGQNILPGQPVNKVPFQQPVPQRPISQVPMQTQFRPTMAPGMQNVLPMLHAVPIMPTTSVPKEPPNITPEEKKEWESAYGRVDAGGKFKKKEKKFLRVAGGVSWEDQSLAEWDPNDFRIFVGDLGNEVTDDSLTRAFAVYPSFQKAKVVRERKTNKTKGYGFVSFKDSTDFIKAMREMNGKYVGNRPIKLRKSTWKDRSVDVVKKKTKEKKKLGLR